MIYQFTHAIIKIRTDKKLNKPTVKMQLSQSAKVCLGMHIEQETG